MKYLTKELTRCGVRITPLHFLYSGGGVRGINLIVTPVIFIARVVLSVGYDYHVTRAYRGDQGGEY